MKKDPNIEEVFYFIRDASNKPVITVCLLYNKNMKTFLARGVAICSEKETPVIKQSAQKRNGPGIARKRAWMAYNCLCNILRIYREEPLSVLRPIITTGNYPFYAYGDWHIFKGFYLTEPEQLSNMEKDLLNKLNNKKITNDNP